MKLTETIKKTLVLSWAVFSLFTGQVIAAESGERDGKVYPGSICVAPRWDQVTEAKYNKRGEFENRNMLSSMDVMCPLVRDNTSARSGLEIVFVYYQDNHPHNDVSCRVSRWDGSKESGFPEEESSLYKSSGTGKGVLTMYFPISSSNYWSYYTVNCSIPGKHPNTNRRTSRITSIRVAERP